MKEEVTTLYSDYLLGHAINYHPDPEWAIEFVFPERPVATLLAVSVGLHDARRTVPGLSNYTSAKKLVTIIQTHQDGNHESKDDPYRIYLLSYLGYKVKLHRHPFVEISAVLTGLQDRQVNLFPVSSKELKTRIETIMRYAEAV